MSADFFEKLRKIQLSAFYRLIFATVSVYILSQKRNLFYVAFGKKINFRKNLPNRTAHFASAHIRNNAVSTKIVASVHNRDKGAKRLFFVTDFWESIFRIFFDFKTFFMFFRGRNYLDQGVQVKSAGTDLVIDLHIIVTYGVNISAIADSIVNKVRYTVEQATGLTVNKVNVFVDGMKE